MVPAMRMRTGVMTAPSSHWDERATVLEYAVMAAAVAAMIIVVVGLVGREVLALFESVPSF